MQKMTLAAWAFPAVFLACASSTPPAGDVIGKTEADAGVADAAEVEPAKPVEKPFAKTPLEATTLINDAVESKSKEITRCVAEYRARAGNKFAKLHVQVGIDQEGMILGVVVKGKDGDEQAKTCVHVALRSAVFPRSHSGVITIDKVFDFAAVYR